MFAETCRVIGVLIVGGALWAILLGALGIIRQFLSHDRTKCLWHFMDREKGESEAAAQSKVRQIASHVQF